MVAATEKSKPLVLAIETATRAGGVAVMRGEGSLSSQSGDASISHSTNLIEMIEGVLREAGAKLSDVDLFAVAVGPGSFTGLRIGLATVKAFAVHLNRKAAGVSTLAALTAGSPDAVPLIDAKRRELFTLRDGAIVAVPAVTFEAAGRICVGDGAIRYREHLVKACE